MIFHVLLHIFPSNHQRWEVEIIAIVYFPSVAIAACTATILYGLLPLFTPFTPPNSTFDKRDSTKSPCFYAEFSIEWFQQNAPKRLTDAGESATIKAQKGILPIDGQSWKLVTKTVTAFRGWGRLLFCVVYVSNQDWHDDPKNHQNNRQQFIVTHQASPLSRFYP